MKFLLVGVFVLLVCGALALGRNGVRKPVSFRFRRQIVKEHMKMRRVHQNTTALVWDTELAEFAQDWCTYLSDNGGKLLHSKDSGYGENLYGSMSTAPHSGIGINAVQKWYAEIKDYDWNNPVFADATGHFTQVVWKGSKKLGCGFASAPSGKYTKTLVCCNYSPPGNWDGQFEANVLKRNKPYLETSD